MQIDSAPGAGTRLRIYFPVADETARRRTLQEAYNQEHGITPETIKKAIFAGIESQAAAHIEANAKVGLTDETQYITEEYIAELEAEMMAAAGKRS